MTVLKIMTVRSLSACLEVLTLTFWWPFLRYYLLRHCPHPHHLEQSRERKVTNHPLFEHIHLLKDIQQIISFKFEVDITKKNLLKGCKIKTVFIGRILSVEAFDWSLVCDDY